MLGLPRFGGRLGILIAAVAAIGLAGAAPTASAQYVDARVLRRGVLRIGIAPSYLSYDRRFDPDGEQEPLGTDLSADSAGMAFLPSLEVAQSAVRAITGDSTYRMTFGTAATDLDADIRSVPLSLALGLTNRVTVTASIPVVTSRMQVAFTLDSMNANVGWNQVSFLSGNDTGLDDAFNLLDDLAASMESLEALIASGAFDCPTGPTCASARDVVARTAALRSNLIVLTGIDDLGNTSPVLPPFAPLASSSAGQAVLAAIQDVASQLLSFGADPVTQMLPLPAGRVTADDVNSVLTSAGFGYDAEPLAFVKYRQRMGDVEVGFRWGLVQQPTVRAAISTTVRLPTGFRDLPSNFVDLGTGDKQTDLIGGAELVLEPGRVVSLALAGDYTLQLSDVLPRRITRPDRPIALASTEFNVSRDLGDVIRLRAQPALRLTQSLLAYASVDYIHKQSDVFTISETMSGGTSVDVADLELETQMRRLSVGAGLHYRSLSGRGRVPVEAGLQYHTAFQGSGGLTPLTTSMRIYLRLFYPIFGGGGDGSGESGAESR